MPGSRVRFPPFPPYISTAPVALQLQEFEFLPHVFTPGVPCCFASTAHGNCSGDEFVDVRQCIHTYLDRRPRIWIAQRCAGCPRTRRILDMHSEGLGRGATFALRLPI